MKQPEEICTPDRPTFPLSKQTTIAIIGCVGLPAHYGGFETLAANLVAYCDRHDLPVALSVYCSGPAYPDRVPAYGGATLRYVPLRANGISSIVYDAWSVIAATWRGDRVILVLGVSGAIVLPIVRLMSSTRLVVNIDGLEWKRSKWSRPAAWFLKLSERIAVRAAHVVVADNRGIIDHVRDLYGCDACEIPYGGDHAVSLLGVDAADFSNGQLDTRTAAPYALMLCRIEPENHIHLILEAFSCDGALDLVAVGNWNNSDYGRALRDRYRGEAHIRIVGPVFDPQALSDLRADAALYVHGHSAGGTNPALVEMMHFATPVAAFDCAYNRHTTENAATYFTTAGELAAIVKGFDPGERATEGERMREIARRRYTWDQVGKRYFMTMGVATP